MKKIIFITLALSVLFISACGAGKEESSSQEDGTSQETNSSGQTEPHVTATVTRDFVDERYSKISLGTDGFISAVPERGKTGTLSDYASDHEKNIDNNFYYRMFKVEGEGYFYVFIRKSQPSEDIDSKDGGSVSHFAYVEKPMKMSDFSGLSVGDTLSEVEAIDPGARYVKDYAINSLHLCSDGLVVIEYDEYVERQERKIRSINFNGDHIFLRNEYTVEYSDESGGVYAIEYPYYSCAIEPEDYPKE